MESAMTPSTVNPATITALKSKIKENATELGMPKDHPMLVKLDDRKPSYLRRLVMRTSTRIDKLLIGKSEIGRAHV